MEKSHHEDVEKTGDYAATEMEQTAVTNMFNNAQSATGKVKANSLSPRHLRFVRVLYSSI